MRPIPVPPEIRSQDWVRETHVYGGPSGDLINDPIPPAEGIIYDADFGEQGGVITCVGVVLYLEDEDLEAIAKGSRYILLSWPGVDMPVFTVPHILEVGSEGR